MKKVNSTPLPPFVKNLITRQKEINQKDKKNKSAFDTTILNGVSEGKRNDAAASFIGKLLRGLPEDQWNFVWQMAENWNKNNKPPLSEDELRNVFESIKEAELKHREADDNKSQSIALQLVDKIRKEKILFFHNEQKEGFAALDSNGREIFKLRSRAFKHYIANHFYKQSGKIISADVINNIIQVLEGKALFDGPCHELSVRITKKGEAIWYDLGDGSVVHIDKDGWTISEIPPIIFRSYKHQHPQVMPQRGGNLKELSKFVNLKNEEERLLFLVYTVAAFIPGFPHPILVFYGPQGSGKTTPQRILKKLIDPSVLNTLSAPDNIREFVQLASHHYFIFFDNVSFLKQWISDSLARAVTGDGFTKRELFSDDDDFLYSFQRVIAVNGINLVIQRADLLERSILIGLEQITKDKRQEEQEFWQELENKKPFFLGAIFDAIAGALGKYPTIRLNSHPRMADFARWGCAIAESLGYTQNQFLTAYYHNIAKQNTEAIDASSVATAIMALMDSRDSWEGTATDLYKELETQATNLKIDTKSSEWPKDPSSLSRKVHVVQANLAEEGIKISKDETVRPKRILIQKILENVDNGDNKIDNQQFESEKDLPAFDNQGINRDIHADNEISTESDGMRGLSRLVEIPKELKEINPQTPWAQYFPQKPFSQYNDGQIEQALIILSDFQEQITEFLGNQNYYKNLKTLLKNEAQQRSLTTPYE